MPCAWITPERPQPGLWKNSSMTLVPGAKRVGEQWLRERKQRERELLSVSAVPCTGSHLQRPGGELIPLLHPQPSALRLHRASAPYISFTIQRLNHLWSRPSVSRKGSTNSSRNWLSHKRSQGFPGGSVGKESVCDAKDAGSIWGGKDPLKEEMATHSSILACETPWTEEHGRLQSTGSQRDTKEGLNTQRPQETSMSTYQKKILLPWRQVQSVIKSCAKSSQQLLWEDLFCFFSLG